MQALGWLLSGTWLLQMAAFLYLLPARTGLHHIIWHSAPNTDEAVATYLAIHLVLCAFILVAKGPSAPDSTPSMYSTVALAAKENSANAVKGLLEAGADANGLVAP